MEKDFNISRIAEPGLWRMSMLIGMEGIDVYARKEVGEPDAVYVSFPFLMPGESRTKSVEELIYSNPVLLQPFRKTDICVAGGLTFIMPKDVTGEVVERLFGEGDGSNAYIKSEMDGRNDILFEIEKDLLNFIRRTFNSIEPVHELSVLSRYFERQNRFGNSTKEYVVASDESMSVLIYNQFGLALASSYECRDLSDKAYYALASAYTSGFDFTEDEMKVFGNFNQKVELMGELKRFTRHIMPGIFPAAVYGADAHALAVPFSLAIIPLCE